MGVIWRPQGVDEVLVDSEQDDGGDAVALKLVEGGGDVRAKTQVTWTGPG